MVSLDTVERDYSCARSRSFSFLQCTLESQYRNIEIKYQFYVSVWLIKELLHYIIELCEWASKAHLTWAKTEYPKREKIPPLCGQSVIIVCL